MKKILIIVFLSFPIFSQDAMKQLAEGTLEQKTEAMLHLGYSGNKAGFWYFVKYLSYTQKENDSISVIQSRAAAAEALGRIRDERSIPYLIDRYPLEKNSYVKGKILFALSLYRDKRITPIAENALSSADESIVFQGLLTAAAQQDPALNPKIDSILTSSQNPALSCTAAYAYLQTGGDRKKTLELLKKYLTSENPEARFWAARHLKSADLFEAIPDLSKAAEIENRYWVSGEIDLALNYLYYKRREYREKRISERNSQILSYSTESAEKKSDTTETIKAEEKAPASK